AEPQIAALRRGRCPNELGEAAVSFASSAVVHGKAGAPRAEPRAPPPPGAARAEADYWSARAGVGLGRPGDRRVPGAPAAGHGVALRALRVRAAGDDARAPVARAARA